MSQPAPWGSEAPATTGPTTRGPFEAACEAFSGWLAEVAPDPERSSDSISKWLKRCAVNRPSDHEILRRRFATDLLKNLDRVRARLLILSLLRNLEGCLVQGEGRFGRDVLTVDPGRLRHDTTGGPGPMSEPEAVRFLDLGRDPSDNPDARQYLAIALLATFRRAVAHSAEPGQLFAAVVGERAERAYNTLKAWAKRDPADYFFDLRARAENTILSPPSAFLSGLGSVILPGDGEDTLGTLTPEQQSRLWVHYRTTATFCVAESEFDAARRVAERLRKELASGNKSRLSVPDWCRDLDALGSFADRLLPVVIGPHAPHRAPTALLLKNLSALGGLGRRALKAVETLGAAIPDYGEDPAEVAEAGATRVHAFVCESQEFKVLKEIVAEAEGTWGRRASDRVALADAIDGLRRRLADFEHKLTEQQRLSPASPAPELSKDVARDLASTVLINSLDRLDQLLPYRDESGQEVDKPEGAPSDLVNLVRRTRTRVLRFVGDHAGIREYKINVNDLLSTHSGRYKIHGNPVKCRLAKDRVARVWQPGYTEGDRPDAELIRKPEISTSE